MQMSVETPHLPSLFQSLRYRNQQDKHAYYSPGDFIFLGKTDKQISSLQIMVCVMKEMWKGIREDIGVDLAGARPRVPVVVSACQSLASVHLCYKDQLQQLCFQDNPWDVGALRPSAQRVPPHPT